MALAKNTHMSYVMTKKANFEVTSMQVSEGRDDVWKIQGAKLIIIQFKMQCLLLENKICGVLGTGIEQKSYKANKKKVSPKITKKKTFHLPKWL